MASISKAYARARMQTDIDHNMKILKSALIILNVLMACAFQAHAEGIIFRDLTLPEAGAKAAEEGKLVFVDCYTPSCGPCKFMARNIFPMDSCGVFMNPRFVSVMKDLEAEDNTYIARKYNVRIYPTFLLLRPDGSLYAKLEGGATKQAGKFIKRVEEALSLGDMEERYEAGQRDIKLLTGYVHALKRPAPGKARAVISDYMETLSAEEMADPDIMNLIGQLDDMDCPGFARLMDNRNGVAAIVGRIKLGQILSSIHRSYTGRLKMMRRTPSDTAKANEATLRSEGLLE